MDINNDYWQRLGIHIRLGTEALNFLEFEKESIQNSLKLYRMHL